ncbi:MAG: DUF3313 family protein [Azospirillum sp.]|nr:DUF3313 family protein [Azospirillum sp.]
MSVFFRSAIAAALVLGLAACTTTNSEPTGGLDAKVPLSPGKEPDTVVYRKPNVDAAKYRGILVLPAQVYRGGDADFGDVSEKDKQALAAWLYAEFSRVLRKSNNVVMRPGPGIVSLQLSLIGVETSRPVLSTALRFTPAGAAMTAGKSLLGMPASFTGSSSFSAEIKDSATGELLGAFVTKQSPPAYNLASGLGELEAARLGITEGAEAFAKALARETGKPRK